MKYFYKKFSCHFLMLLFMMAGFLSACSSGSEKKDSEEESEEEIMESVPVEEQLVDDFNKSKLIFYSLPSPLETAMLIKRAGATFESDILNPLDNISRYNTNREMALNLGIYSADMSYASLFDQTQTTIEYMGNAQKLADELGIMGAIDEETIKSLEENMNNREVVMDIISETFMNSNAYLSENNRAAISVMVLAGGWLEGLYLATSLTNGEVEANKKLVDRILYQKLSLVTLLNMMENYRDNPDIEELITDFKELESIFERITLVTTSDVETEIDTSERMTTIRANSEIDISVEDFTTLCAKIEELRSDFIS
ncbi:MAG: hypothetical protein R6U46_12035 [Marinilabilia sp.]